MDGLTEWAVEQLAESDTEFLPPPKFPPPSPPSTSPHPKSSNWIIHKKDFPSTAHLWRYDKRSDYYYWERLGVDGLDVLWLNPENLPEDINLRPDTLRDGHTRLTVWSGEELRRNLEIRTSRQKEIQPRIDVGSQRDSSSMMSPQAQLSNKRSILNWLEVRLCETCKAVNFEALAVDTYSTRASRRNMRHQEADMQLGDPDMPLGLLSDIIARSSRCSVCALIASAGRRKDLLEKYPNFDEVKCGIRLEGYAKSKGVEFNRFNITLIHSPRRDDPWPETILSLQACKNPLPSVKDSCLEYESNQLTVRRASSSTTATARYIDIPSGRLMDPHLNPQLFRDWITACKKEHGQACEAPQWLTPDDKQHYFLRMIDLHQAYIVDAPRECTYFALSYVWGPQSDHYIRLLKSNIARLHKQRSLVSLDILPRIPKTILDAMSLVQNLGYRYLWVDSLCIVQDDDKDKATQMEYMDSVYALALCTIIAADGSQADHGLAGWTNNPRHVRQACAKVSENMSLMRHIHLFTGTAYNGCTWKTRGWTMQERLCSRRTIMLTADQAFWQCGKSEWCETMALEPFFRSDLDFKIISKHVLGCYGLMEGNEKTFHPIDVDGTISEYCQRKLSYQSDALKAIEAYFRRVTKKFFLAQFLWGHLAFVRFDESLAWSGEYLKRRTEEHAQFNSSGEIYKVPFPSWSWLGWEGRPFHLPHSRKMLAYELVFYRLDVDGRVAALCPPLTKYQTLPDMSQLSLTDRSEWKGDTYIAVDEFPPERPFNDSGRLLFWTSKADLCLKDEPRYPSIDPMGQYSKQYLIVKEDGTKVGELDTQTFPECSEGLEFSFIVVSRVYIDDRKIRALPQLKVLMVHWEDEDKHVANRITAGTVDEDAWVRVKRDWIKVTLQ